MNDGHQERRESECSSASNLTFPPDSPAISNQINGCRSSIGSNPMNEKIEKSSVKEKAQARQATAITKLRNMLPDGKVNIPDYDYFIFNF